MSRSTSKKADSKPVDQVHTEDEIADAKAADQEERNEAAPQAEAPVVDRDTAIRQSYNEALGALKDRHLDEFNELRSGIVRGYGHEWAPKPTEAQKREQQLRALLEEDPDLAARILAEQGAANTGVLGLLEG